MEIDQKEEKSEPDIKHEDYEQDKESEKEPTKDIVPVHQVSDEEKKNPISSKDKPKFLDRLKKFWSKRKNRLITEATVGLIVIFCVGVVLLRWYQEQSKTNNSASNQTTTSVAKKVPSILSGLPVDEALANRHPLGVIIENHVDARPQSGLSEADIVYEAIAEGGITRFLALFSSQNAPKIGPIRSARTYFVDFAKEYNAYLAHVGGNYDALEKITAEGILDLDQFQNSAYYERDSQKALASEHTVYSSTDKLFELATKKNYTPANIFTPLKFKTEAVASARPASQKVTIDFGSSQYQATFTYDPTNNVYQRSIGGSADLDKQTGQRIAPKNLILEEVTRTLTTTKINEKGYIFNTSGTGTATIFQDGKMMKGTWKKNSSTDRTFYYDAAGNEISLNPGQTWIAIVHPDLKVTIE